MKANELRITGKSEIILSTPKGSMAGFCWDGEKLVHSTGKIMRFSAPLSAEIAEAVSNSHQAEYETKMGYEIKDADRGVWEFIGVVNDAHGRYTRCLRARKSISVVFAKADLV